VAKALHRLGMPSLLDIQMLNDRVAQLETQLAALNGKTKTPTQTASAKASKPAAKSARQASTKTVAKSLSTSDPKTTSASARKPRKKSP
jgi:cell division septum initiation protein DivIVA